jgi:hypothetical protein
VQRYEPKTVQLLPPPQVKVEKRADGITVTATPGCPRGFDRPAAFVSADYEETVELGEYNYYGRNRDFQQLRVTPEVLSWSTRLPWDSTSKSLHLQLQCFNKAEYYAYGFTFNTRSTDY